LPFDKTGTLTLGEPQVTDIVAVSDWTETAVLELAGSAEGRSNHPLAQAIAAHARLLGLSAASAQEVENLTGRGLRASVGGRWIWIGSKRCWWSRVWMFRLNYVKLLDNWKSRRKTVVFVGVEDRAVGLIGVADTVRPEAQTALQDLVRLGVRQTIMLSGDNPRSAATIANQLGVEGFKAGLMPEEKLIAVDELVAVHGLVGMVGDGVNDAPALAHATVGIALGTAKNDIALEAADIALMSADLCKLPFAVGLGQALRRITVQNL